MIQFLDFFLPPLESSTTLLILWALIGYLLGSIPIGIIIAKAMKLGDLREIGSGNIGATNVLRTGSKKAAILTLLLDAGKGALAVLLSKTVAAGDAAQLAGLMAFIGHCFPVWLRFKGGKGVATYLGIMLMLAWPVGLIACVIWVIVAGVSRYSSVAALIMAGWLPIAMSLVGHVSLFPLGMILGVLIYFRHWGNIDRLRKGTETKIGAK